MKPPPIDESTLVFRRPGPDDADALAALYNDPAPGLMQLPYTDAAYWRQRNAQPSDGTAAQSLTLMARRTLLPELVLVPWSQARPAALRAQHRIEFWPAAPTLRHCTRRCKACKAGWPSRWLEQPNGLDVRPEKYFKPPAHAKKPVGINGLFLWVRRQLFCAFGVTFLTWTCCMGVSSTGSSPASQPDVPCGSVTRRWCGYRISNNSW